MLVVNCECEDVSLFLQIQLKWINEYEPSRFKTLDFVYCNEIIISALIQLIISVK